jgi:hypothetical protein
MLIKIQQRLASPKVKKFSGIHATYFRLNKKWGVKFFDSSKFRDLNYELLESLYRHGIAPEVGAKVEFEHTYGIVYGFLIEHCKPFDTECMKFFDLKKTVCTGREYCQVVCPDGNYYQIFMDANPKYRTALKDLKAQCQAIDFDWTDPHGGNWGFNRKGKAVIFDVSCEAEYELYQDSF